MTRTFKVYFFAALVLAGLTSYFNPPSALQHQPVVGAGEVSIAQLPPEARNVWRTIQTNGPFAYPKKDGEVFGNFEKKLPVKPKGYYRAYTVPTKGLLHRGPKRLVTGGRSKTMPEVAYYTTDHYQSFSAIKF